MKRPALSARGRALLENAPRTVVVGSGNTDKAREISLLLKDLKFRVLSLKDFKSVPKVVEDGGTFESNACKKARAYSRLSEYLTVADDSGLCVNALNGKPGVYSARYAGPGCTYADNNAKLLKALTHNKNRAACFVSTVALYRQGHRIAVFRGEVQGRIATSSLGARGFGYDPVFIPEGFKKSFGQISPAAKNTLSHRGRAFGALKAFLQDFF